MKQTFVLLVRYRPTRVITSCCLEGHTISYGDFIKSLHTINFTSYIHIYRREAKIESMYSFSVTLLDADDADQRTFPHGQTRTDLDRNGRIKFLTIARGAPARKTFNELEDL